MGSSHLWNSLLGDSGNTIGILPNIILSNSTRGVDVVALQIWEQASSNKSRKEACSSGVPCSLPTTGTPLFRLMVRSLSRQAGFCTRRIETECHPIAQEAALRGGPSGGDISQGSISWKQLPKCLCFCA